MIYLNLDLSALLSMQDMESKVRKALQGAARDMAAAVHAHIVEEASKKLHTRRQPYVDALSFQQLSRDVWFVNLKKEARWIEDGMCVVYGNANKPSILTPDGWVKITEAKIGMLVLNQFGKWTPIVAIHNNELFDYCVEFVDEQATASIQVDKKKFDHHKGTGKRGHKAVVARCLNCNATRMTSRFKMTDPVGGVSHCNSCKAIKKLVSLHIVKQGFEKKLVLTEDHKVFTQRGWVPAKDLKRIDKVYVPAWGACGFCGKKVAFGGKWCDHSCAMSGRLRDDLLNGRHPSQRPECRKKNFKRSGQLGKGVIVNQTEEKASEAIENAGYSVDFFKNENNTADWIRQYPVPSFGPKGHPSNYYLDFYCPKLGLAIEIDGYFHFTSKGLERDKKRDAVLRSKGIEPIHIPAHLVKSTEKFTKTFLSLCANHGEDIELVPASIIGLKTIVPSKSTSFTRRWDVTVAEGDSFVCQGILIHNSKHDQLQYLLKSPKAKTAKDGSRYLTVPFRHDGGPTQQTSAQQDLLSTIKQEMKKRDIPYMKIERNDKGQVKTGLLHRFNITDAPLKTSEGPGQGKGPIGAVRQGNTGVPFLQGVNIYQKLVKQPGGLHRIQRGIFTFRVASSKQEGTGKWQHPGVEGVRLFDDAVKWAVDLWEKTVGPKILADMIANLD